jgi:hypothetical protein
VVISSCVNYHFWEVVELKPGRPRAGVDSAEAASPWARAVRRIISAADKTVTLSRLASELHVANPTLTRWLRWPAAESRRPTEKNVESLHITLAKALGMPSVKSILDSFCFCGGPLGDCDSMQFVRESIFRAVREIHGVSELWKFDKARSILQGKPEEQQKTILQELRQHTFDALIDRLNGSKSNEFIEWIKFNKTFESHDLAIYGDDGPRFGEDPCISAEVDLYQCIRTNLAQHVPSIADRNKIESEIMRNVYKYALGVHKRQQNLTLVLRNEFAGSSETMDSK